MRLFTVEEANGLLLRLDDRLTQAQDLLSKMRWVRDQLVDLRIIWGEKILDPDNADAREYETHRLKFTHLEAELQEVTTDINAMGCELKDVENGLVDFVTSRGEEIVYLCWKKGEHRVEWWHPLEGGFAGRQPLETF